MSRGRRLSLAGVALVATLASPPAAADAPAPRGVYLRLDVGYGYTGYRPRALYNQIEAGATAIGALTAGGTIGDDWLLYGAVELDGVHAFAADSSSTTLSSLGVGVARFMDPCALVLSTSLRLVQLRWSATDAGFSGIGPGLDVSVGKDIPIARRWSVGAAGRLFVATVSLPAERITPYGVALLLSVARR